MKRFIHNELDTILHFTMSLVGGFLGTYAIVSRGGTFANAQTGNIMSMTEDLFGRNWIDFLVRFGALAVFALSMAVSYLMSTYTNFHMRKLCLRVDAVALLLTAFLPDKVPGILALYPIFIASSFQWGTYSGARGYGSATIFSTNNLKQSVLGWTQYIINHDPRTREKALLYTFTIVFFVIGTFLGCEAVVRFGHYGAFVGIFFLALAHAFIVIAESQNVREAEEDDADVKV